MSDGRTADGGATDGASAGQGTTILCPTKRLNTCCTTMVAVSMSKLFHILKGMWCYAVCSRQNNNLRCSQCENNNSDSMHSMRQSTGLSLGLFDLYFLRCQAIAWRNADFMMTSSNGNIFRVTDHLWGESIGHRWIPPTKASDAELLCFLWSASEQTVE